MYVAIPTAPVPFRWTCLIDGIPDEKDQSVRSRRLLLTLTLLAGLFLVPGTAWAASPYQRGPDPTLASISATTGPFAIATAQAPRGNGFGGGTIYYPTSTTDGKFGAIAVSPGFTNPQSRIAWYGPRLASQGFVVITIDTNSPLDQPGQRGTELLAALQYVATSSTVKDRVDPNRLATMGHSMGGGGALDAARSYPQLKAAIPLAGYETNSNFSTLKVPSLVFGMQNDTTAPTSVHSKRFYSSMPATLDKAYVEIAGAAHSAPTSPNPIIAAYSISWLKRFVDGDLRYDQFLCPIPASVQGVSAIQGTCPHTTPEPS